VGRHADNGYALVEVLIATAVASLALAAAAGLLVASARAVSESDAETTATWLAMTHLESWRSSSTPVPDMHQRVDGRFDVHLRADRDTAEPLLWHVRVSITGARLRVPILLQSVTTREAP